MVLLFQVETSAATLCNVGTWTFRVAAGSEFFFLVQVFLVVKMLNRKVFVLVLETFRKKLIQGF